MEEDDFLNERIKSLEASVAFFSPRNKAERELWVAEAFLTNLGLIDGRGELSASNADPPDVVFRDARFEIKEILDEGRRRHAEYKQELQDALASRSINGAFRLFHPKDLHVSDIYSQCLTEAERLTQKYHDSARGSLDLLFYVNLKHIFDVIAETFPDVSAMSELGWRSISFVKGHRSCCFFAGADAPNFLRMCCGKVVIRTIP